MKNFNKILAIVVIVIMYVILTFDVIHDINHINSVVFNTNEYHSDEFMKFSYIMSGISILFAAINILIMKLYNKHGRYLIIKSNKMIVKSSVYIMISQTMLIWALFVSLLSIKVFEFQFIPLGTIVFSAIIVGIITNILLYTISIRICRRIK